jgi:thiopurine S-methyltransferase
MHEAFWQARWSRSEIGFHQAEVNAYLRRHWPSLQLHEAAQVLVPLCGKSLDMLWLLSQGHRVLGVELAQKAVEDFFAENQLVPQITRTGDFLLYRVDNLQILCGDFFALGVEHLRECAAFYDRAALIALPVEMRVRYVAHLNAMLPRACQGLLVTLDYPQAQMSGPPFAVADAEVRELFEGAWQIQALECRDVLRDNDNWKFLQRGLAHLEERVYRLLKD